MSLPVPAFAARTDATSIETGTVLMPRFDADGLIVALAVDADAGDVLMVAYMNAEALARTIEAGEVWFWSRSRQELWRKGEKSGNTLRVAEMRVDCDQDAIFLKVRVGGDGVTCHQGYRSCFYRSIPVGEASASATTLVFDEGMPRVTKPG